MSNIGIGQEYAKELEKTAIHDLQETISQQEVMKSIIDRMETEDVAKMHRAQTSNSGGRQQKNTSYGRSTSYRRSTSYGRSSDYEKRWCYFCEEIKNGKAKTHNTSDCILRNKNKRKQRTSK